MVNPKNNSEDMLRLRKAFFSLSYEMANKPLNANTTGNINSGLIKMRFWFFHAQSKIVYKQKNQTVYKREHLFCKTFYFGSVKNL